MHYVYAIFSKEKRVQNIKENHKRIRFGSISGWKKFYTTTIRYPSGKVFQGVATIKNKVIGIYVNGINIYK